MNFAIMTVQQIHECAEGDEMQTEDDTAAALRRLADLSVGICHPLVRFSLTLLADMPQNVAGAYADELAGDVGVEHHPTTYQILLAAETVLRRADALDDPGGDTPCEECGGPLAQADEMTVGCPNCTPKEA